MHFSYRSLWNRLRKSARYLRWRFGAGQLKLQPLDQLELVADEPGLWRATGNDPKFDCVGSCFPLRAGWYRLSIDMQGVDGDRLEPTLYFDYGYGMHEAWSLHLHFIRPGTKRHTGIVLLPLPVQRLRFDPTSVSCTFHVQRFTFSRLSRVAAGWHMLRALSRERQQAGGASLELWVEAWQKLRESGKRHDFAEWLHGLYVRRGAKAPTYARWLKFYDQSAAPVRARCELLVSVLLPTFNTPELWLRSCLNSVLAQSYPHWELCVADDASTEPQVRAVLEEYAGRDPRIRSVWRERNGHISAASNSALATARGDYVALLDHDDELHPAALATIVEALQCHPQWQFVYSDEDKIDADGQRYDPYFKPDWNPDLLCGQNCVSHLGVYSRSLMNAVGGFREGLEGSQDWDLALRCSERLQPEQIGHVPAVLYHWRAIAGSTAQGVDQKGYAHDAGRRAPPARRSCRAIRRHRRANAIRLLFGRRRCKQPACAHRRCAHRASVAAERRGQCARHLARNAVPAHREVRHRRAASGLSGPSARRPHAASGSDGRVWNAHRSPTYRTSAGMLNIVPPDLLVANRSV